MLSSFSVFASDWTGSVDIAETSLRIVLNRPANGGQFPKEMVTKERQLEAISKLMNLEMRYPGLLKGKLKPGFKWSQYKEVQDLFSEFEEKMGFWYDT